MNGAPPARGSGAPEARLRSIEIVEDLTASSRCDEGFLRLRRLRLRNLYVDGSHSTVYPCDVLSRPGSDAVVAVLYEIDGERCVRVMLRDAPRAPVYLRCTKRFVQRRYTGARGASRSSTRTRRSPSIS